MDDFKADIIAANKKGRVALYGFLGVIIIAIAVLIVLQIIPIFLQLFSIVIWVFAVLKYYLQSKKQVLKKKVGDLRISKDLISIDEANYEIAKASSIKLCVSGWRSYKRSNDRSHPVSEMHDGDKNFITVVADNTTTTCEFLLTSKEQWSLIREHLISWYCRNVNVSEDCNGGVKTYGLQVLNYSEIQKFKQHIQASKTLTA